MAPYNTGRGEDVKMSKKSVLALLVQTALAYVALFTAWGWDDVPGYFAHPARSAFVAVTLLSLLAIFVFHIDLQMFRRGSRPVGRQRWILALVFTVSLSLLLFLPYADSRSLLTLPGSDFLRYLGVALYASGNVIAFFAVRALGQQYSGYVTLQEDLKLVQHGIYSVIRHPIYLRILMVTLGLPLIFSKLAGAAHTGVGFTVRGLSNSRRGEASSGALRGRFRGLCAQDVAAGPFFVLERIITRPISPSGWARNNLTMTYSHPIVMFD